ncbi:MAG: polymer-forming cytoskeletal protein [Chloroflexia bacterium]|nr:polymer-forming cytoskeletal protein [Chloroflexia bacterium]
MSMRTYDAANYASQSDYQATSGQEDSASVFDRYSIFDGTFNLTRDLRVEGQVKGTINCKGTLYVAHGATVDAVIEAENITVAGDLEGEVNCRGKMQILESGKVKGKITTGTLVVNEGAFYEGQLVMESGEQSFGTVTPRASRVRSSTPSVSTGTANPAPTDTPVIGAAAGGNTFIRRFGGQEQTWDTGDDDGASPPTSS